MHRPESITLTYSDGYAAYARYWPATGSPQGAVLYLHGIQSHGGWFEQSAETLAAAGLHVLLPDRRGSGANCRARGHVRSAGRLLADVAEGIAWLQQRAGRPEIHLVGVSWGGKLALAAAMRQPATVDTLVLVAPGLCPAVDLPRWQKALIGLSAVFQPGRMFPIPLNEPELFTDNRPRQAFIRDDPLRLRTATARFLAASRILDVRIRRQLGRQVWPFAVRLLLACKERIIDNGRTKCLTRGLRCRDMRVFEYAGAAHTLEFQPDPSEYLADLVSAVRAGNSRETGKE